MMIRVRLDWLIDVREVDDQEAAVEIATDYMTDQSLVELLEYEQVRPEDDEGDEPEITVTLYPADDVIPVEMANAPGAVWSTYHREAK